MPFREHEYQLWHDALLATLSTISDLVYVYDDQYRFIFANRALLELWQVDQKDLVGRPLANFVEPASLARRLEQQIDYVLRTGESVVEETTYVTPAGEERFFEYSYWPYENDDVRWVIGSTRDITYRKQLENTLVLQNHELSSILESITDAFYSLDTDWNLVYVNHRAAELLRRNRDDLTNTKVWDAFPETVSTELHSHYREAMERQEAIEFTYYYQPLQTWFDIRAYPSLEYLSVYFRDITEQVKVAQDLEKSERRYRTLTDVMPQMVWLTDPNGYHLYYNQQWYEYTGLTVEESLGFGFTNALHPEDRLHTLERWERAWRTGETYEIEYRFYSRELQGYRWFLGRALPVRDADGAILEWVGTCTDIEPQKQAESRLRENEQRLAEAQRITRVGNWELNLRTGKFSCSDEHCQIFGVDPAFHTDQPRFIECIHPDDRPMVRIAADNAIAELGAYDVEYRILRQDGTERIVHTVAEVHLDMLGRAERLTGTAHDITERKEIERTLREYSEQQRTLTQKLQELNNSLELQVSERTQLLQERTAELQTLSLNLEKLVKERTHELEQSRAELAYRAQHDPLTGLANRTLLEDRLAHAIQNADRNKTSIAVLFIDLDGFKFINDSMGHSAGDIVLKDVAHRLSNRVRESDTIARIGGDEFVVMLGYLDYPHSVHSIAEQLRTLLNEPYVVLGRTARLSASIGVSLYPRDALTVFELLRHSDAAMYRAKQVGKNEVRFYSRTMNVEARERLEIGSHLGDALEKNELSLHFQPQWNVIQNTIPSFEALLRWNSPDLGSVSPAQFIPVAEDNGMIIDIGHWVLEESCRQAGHLSQRFERPIRIAVNVSPAQLQREQFVTHVLQTIRKHALEYNQIELELTERIFIQNIDLMSERLAQLRARGVRVAMDDFGAGSSSLSNLVRLPIDTIKIDRGFIKQMQSNPAADRVVQAVVALAKGIGVTVVAEGVETPDQQQRLVELNCDVLQGFHVGYPVPALNAECWLLEFDQRTHHDDELSNTRRT